MKIPGPRGPVSRWVAGVLAGGDGRPPALPAGPLSGDEDTQLALWMMYELHYRGFDDADGYFEWDPRLIAVRRDAEARFEAELRAHSVTTPHSDIAAQLLALPDTYEGPSLALFLQRRASRDQILDYLRERSLHQLKESDPHSFVLGRLDGPAKVALAELQYDEYGGGRPERLHARLYADAMAAAGLNPTYGAYVEQVSAITLASANAMSMFAFNRRLRGAAMGHLAIFEATSSVPCRRIVSGLGRVGFPQAVAAYFEEHIEADAVHEHLAARDICAAMVAAEPDLARDVLFGASACLHLDGLAAQDLLARWTASMQEAS